MRVCMRIFLTVLHIGQLFLNEVYKRKKEENVRERERERERERREREKVLCLSHDSSK